VRKNGRYTFKYFSVRNFHQFPRNLPISVVRRLMRSIVPK
jgi:hypothetical protein